MSIHAMRRRLHSAAPMFLQRIGGGSTPHDGGENQGRGFGRHLPIPKRVYLLAGIRAHASTHTYTHQPRGYVGLAG